MGLIVLDAFVLDLAAWGISMTNGECTLDERVIDVALVPRMHPMTS
jgi:hypothetical protein